MYYPSKQLPSQTQKYPISNPFLEQSYLPETYFPHLKRPLMWRPFNPEIDSVQQQLHPNKRRRTCPTPIEHLKICELKKLERNNNASNNGLGACHTHERLITLPLKVLSFLISNEAKMERIENLQGAINEEVSELSRIVRQKEYGNNTMSKSVAAGVSTPSNDNGTWGKVVQALGTPIIPIYQYCVCNPTSETTETSSFRHLQRRNSTLKPLLNRKKPQQSTTAAFCPVHHNNNFVAINNPLLTTTATTPGEFVPLHTSTPCKKSNSNSSASEKRANDLSVIDFEMESKQEEYRGSLNQRDQSDQEVGKRRKLLGKRVSFSEKRCNDLMDVD